MNNKNADDIFQEAMDSIDGIPAPANPLLKFKSGVFGRFEPVGAMSNAICKIAKRKTLRKDELVALSDEGGFDVEVE